ncbi:16S rRNA (cytidine(1402)-2'-O)-methyltransferase [Thiorhodococcus mannitoliphagus]|uniref:Ribosomal RNA small subunit methyltransferase I n=1 Tax=Thiorhodococcus mannitoliphagus TaxID=329406 RepID=A0A6P1DS84_9GAMM|nr:16S rRNA (cytidine(1402)-2'-O)-methyltransferase [Thiorhodococcus mannitoliphagus]NEX18862.1 16S rRNA (cytidine(1402)-2'-O)-methyltransferase [Thiorhodococcus mannitoliphagus]
MLSEAGILYVVATPIGNLGDITERARKLLTEVDLIAAEDTRETLKLLRHFGITAKLVAYHDHNEEAMAARLVGDLEAGRSIALVSDAGTPLISDPGYRLVAAARAHGLAVVPIPGVSALICALSASGLPSDRFLFLGFPPRGGKQRRALLESIAHEPGTLGFYESGKRIIATLNDLRDTLGAGRRAVIARELTKRFETFLSGSAGELIERLEADAAQRLGEMVLLVEGHQAAVDLDGRVESERVLGILCDALPLSQAAAVAARLTGAKKNQLYRLGLELGLGQIRENDNRLE